MRVKWTFLGVAGDGDVAADRDGLEVRSNKKSARDGIAEPAPSSMM